MPANLYDLAPVFHLLVMAMLIALVPLCWVWLRHAQESTPRRIQLLTWLTLFLTFDLVMFGAFTRLTDSGLGCPDWPGCYGFATPFGANAHIQEAQDNLPHGPVTFAKAWIEMIHRYLAMAVGGLILTLATFAWYRRIKLEVQNPIFWPTLSLIWVCVQGAFGALTVTMKLFPLIVTLHLFGGLTLVALLILQAQSHQKFMSLQPQVKVRSATWWMACMGLVLLVMQVLLGGWVSSNYAVLACNTFPMCQNAWWPEMNLTQGFTLWRELGGDGQGGLLTFQALTAIHYVHRLFAYVVFVYLGALAWWVHRHAVWESFVRVLTGLLVLQLITGLSNVVLDWPLVAAVLHTGGAAALIATMVWFLNGSKVTN
jgi:cytochrome c oxidase assembly protein subunit 15